MKKIILLAGLFISTFTQGQENGRNSASKGTPPSSPAYANDLIIENAPAMDQRRVRLSVAFNGWIYSALSTVDSLNNLGGISIRRSKDNGFTWESIDSYSVPSVRYETFDIVVAGTDTTALTLYLVGVNHDVSGGNYTLFVDRYNATTGAFNGSNFNQANGARKIYDVSIASDYRFPAVGASPYSVAFLYSSYSSSYDSISYVASIDGGATFGVRQSVATTGSYFRNVSLAYGRSASASNGRYFGAWEQLAFSLNRVGHIYTSRSQSTIDGNWIPPVNLDSTSSTMINQCRNPQIASQFNNTDNDSGSVTTVVLVERDYSANGSDYDVLGLYNKRSHYTNFWYRLDVVNSGENDLQPDVTYDPGYNNFLATYYDSTNGKLPYIVNSYNLATPSTWVTISPQYNDVSTNLKAAYPRVEINPVVNQTAHAWISEGVGTKGVALFDAEYNAVSINENHGYTIAHSVFPNPASNSATINFTLEKTSDISIELYNTLGQIVSVRNIADALKGKHSEGFNTSNLENGVYIYQINDGVKTFSGRLVVAH